MNLVYIGVHSNQFEIRRNISVGLYNDVVSRLETNQCNISPPMSYFDGVIHGYLKNDGSIDCFVKAALGKIICR